MNITALNCSLSLQISLVDLQVKGDSGWSGNTEVWWRGEAMLVVNDLERQRC